MGSNKYKILVITSKSGGGNHIPVLSRSYQVITADAGPQGMVLCASHCPDLIVLDLKMEDAAPLVQAVRSHSHMPLLVLSQRQEEACVVAALDSGADEYLPACVGQAELLARVRAALRLRSRYAYEARGNDREYCHGEIRIDYAARRVYFREQEIPLTRTEYNIVALLLLHRGQLLSYDAIIKEIWGKQDDGGIKKLQVNVAIIRKKMGIRPSDDRYIINEPGIGYRIGSQGV